MQHVTGLQTRHLVMHRMQRVMYIVFYRAPLTVAFMTTQHSDATRRRNPLFANDILQLRAVLQTDVCSTRQHSGVFLAMEHLHLQRVLPLRQSVH
jgi:hypothetical protein